MEIRHFFTGNHADETECREVERSQSLFPFSKPNVADHIRREHAAGEQIEPVLAKE